MSDPVADRLRQMAASASIEVTPKHASALAELGDLLPAGSTIFITSLPG